MLAPLGQLVPVAVSEQRSVRPPLSPLRRSHVLAGSARLQLRQLVTQRQMAQQLADNDARLAALRDEMAAQHPRDARRHRADSRPAPTGSGKPDVVPAAGSPQSALVDEIKRQLQSEMGLFPVRLLRERRESFVELNAYDNFGKTSYGTAGYLGNGYFITVKHGVIALDEPSEGRRRAASRRSRSATRARTSGAGRRFRQRQRRGAPRRLGDHQGARRDRPAAAADRHRLRLRLRRADLPPRQRLLEGHHPEHRLRRPADAERPRHLPHRRPPRRVGRRRAEPGRRPGRHSDRPDAGRLPLLVHPAAAPGDVPEGARPGSDVRRPPDDSEWSRRTVAQATSRPGSDPT